MFGWRHRVSGYFRRHPLLAFALGLHLAITALVCAVVLPSRTALRALDIGMPSDYQPGNIVSDPSLCKWDHDYWRMAVSCTDRAGTGARYYVTYDPANARVIRVARWLGNVEIRLGDLILAWGQPNSTGSGFLSWGTRKALMVNSWGASPFDKVYIISYSTEPMRQDSWHGFINRQPYPISRALRR